MQYLWCSWVFLVFWGQACLGQTSSCSNGCFNGGTLDDSDCSCSCPISCPEGYYLDETDCSCQCPVGWVAAQPASSDSVRRCYKRFNVENGQSASFWRNDTVNGGCSAQGARLATFTTRAEFYAAGAACRADRSDPLYWAAGCWTDGVVDQETKNRTGPWYWASSPSDNTTLLQSGEDGLWAGDEPSAFWFDLWAGDEPSAVLVERCVQFLEGGLLNDYQCEGRLSAICMREQPLCSTVRTCLNGGTQNQADCSCSCSNGCLNGGTLNETDCSCSCPSPGDSRNVNCSCSNSCPEGYYLDETDCSCQCPVGWVAAQPASSDSVRRCYKRFNVKGQASFWRNDTVGCSAQGARLATFTTRAEFNAASAACRTDRSYVSSPLQGCWTDGVVDQMTKNRNGPWYWASSPSDSTALLRSGEEGLWADNEPSGRQSIWQGKPDPDGMELCVKFLESGLLGDCACAIDVDGLCMLEQPRCSTVRNCSDGQIQDPITCTCTSPPSSPGADAPNYRIAGAGATYPVKALLGWTDEAGDQHDLLYLDLYYKGAWNNKRAWSGASCVNSTGLFKGANMADVKINDRVGAVVRLAGDGDGGWLYRIVKCTTTNTLVLAVGDNWSLDDTHCPTDGLDSAGDCSKCMPRGRQSSDPNDYYDAHCSSGPPSAKAAALTSVILAGGKAGHLAYADAQGRWLMALPKSAHCSDLTSLFAATNTAGVVTMAGDVLGAWRYTYSECDDSTATIVVEPYQWAISPDYCPFLDCLACLPQSANGSCSPSQLVPSDLQVETFAATIILTWAFAPGATSSFAVYTTSYRSGGVELTSARYEVDGMQKFQKSINDSSVRAIQMVVVPLFDLAEGHRSSPALAWCGGLSPSVIRITLYPTICVPLQFNWRSMMRCPTSIMDQGTCGGGYAFALAAAATDRVCHMPGTEDEQMFSPQQILDCPETTADRHPCEGRNLGKAAQTVSDKGLPTASGDLAGGCLSYKYSTYDSGAPSFSCPYTCDNGTSMVTTTTYRAGAATDLAPYRLDLESIMGEIYYFGPVAATVFVCDSFMDFLWGSSANDSRYWLFANSWGLGRIAMGSSGIDTTQIIALPMARQFRRQAMGGRQVAGAAEVMPGAPTQGNVDTVTAMNAAQVALDLWSSSTTHAAGAAAYEVSTINSVTYQVVSGIITTTDLVATNGQNTVHLVSTHYVNAAGELASFVAHEATVTSALAAAGTSATAIILAAISAASLVLTVAAIATGTAIVYKRHRQAQALLAAHDQGSAAHDVEMENIIQGIADMQQHNPKNGPVLAGRLPAAPPPAAVVDDQPTWRMRIKSITGRAPTIIVDSTNTKNRPLPLGAVLNDSINYITNNNNQE